MNISYHALEQFAAKVSGLKLAVASPSTKEKLRKRMIEFVNAGEEIQLNPKEAVIRLLNNSCIGAKYIYSNIGVLFVLVNDEVVTCYPFKKKRIHEVLR